MQSFLNLRQQLPEGHLTIGHLKQWRVLQIHRNISECAIEMLAWFLHRYWPKRLIKLFSISSKDSSRWLSTKASALRHIRVSLSVGESLLMNPATVYFDRHIKNVEIHFYLQNRCSTRKSERASGAGPPATRYRIKERNVLQNTYDLNDALTDGWASQNCPSRRRIRYQYGSQLKDSCCEGPHTAMGSPAGSCSC